MDRKEFNKNLFIRSLEERAKELNCLYNIDEILSKKGQTDEEKLKKLINTIPSGFQYNDFCITRITVDDEVYQPDNFQQTEWFISANIKLQEILVGNIEVFHTIKLPNSDVGQFLKEEDKLLNTIAERISQCLFYNRLKNIFSQLKNDGSAQQDYIKPEWVILLDLLKHTDQNLFSIISRKMIIQLFWEGITEAQEIFSRIVKIDDEVLKTEVNKPSQKQILEKSSFFSKDIFDVAVKYRNNDEILNYIQKWMNEEKLVSMVKILSNPNSPISEIYDILRKYYITGTNELDENTSVIKGLRASLVRRFLTDQLEFINIAKNYCRIHNFFILLENLIYPNDSHGKLGGKTAGLFLAKKILETHSVENNLLETIKTPKTWYVTSDAIMVFMYYNNLEDIIQHKYKDIHDIRQEYSYVIQAFKNSTFPPELINGLSRALDDFGDNPIIVRSSSLLEDRLGAIFAGKYKSLFLANQGTKKERLEALCDAIAEVYASIFGPDPIGYRIERGLLDFNEEMGIMIQEVVGKKFGNYFFPAFAGVAFSNNEFRWSPRIKRDDGLIRIVTGLGTRAVDRIGDDYPHLIAPGNTSFRLNLSIEDTINYSQKKLDVINLETNTFETHDIDDIIKLLGNQYPMINQIFSIHEHTYIKTPVGLGIDTKKDDIIVTFENLVVQTKYINQIKAILDLLKDKLSCPVDIEFACDGTNLYLLQSRPQSSKSETTSAIIPKNIPPDKILFTANKLVSNGKMPDINYIVYVDAIKYGELKNLEDLKLVGKIVGDLNQILPKKKFILMGPGRWGSRGDISLGVSVTYTDINNSAMLIEIARAKGNYLPDLSFGTHFFQDLVESDIKYLPLYPDDGISIFNDDFFNISENILTRFLPLSENMSDVIKVININEMSKGNILRILMNADEELAIAYITEPNSTVSYSSNSMNDSIENKNEPWQFRWDFAERMALELDYAKFGVKNIYLFGTVFHKIALSNSDLDLLIHYDGDPANREKLELWFMGWNASLAEINYNKTGYKVKKFLDIEYITDDDLKRNDYFAKMIDPLKINSYKLQRKD